MFSTLLFAAPPPHRDTAGDAIVLLVYFGVIFGVFAVLAFIAEQLDKRDRRAERQARNGY
jgi:hypothetical protein